MSIGSHVETERTFALDAGTVLPPLRDWPQVDRVSVPAGMQLVARYFDTRSLQLARAKITLRRRTGGHDDGWHFKLPARADARIEHTAPLSDGIPGDLIALADPSLSTRDLVPICELRTQRTEWSLQSGPSTLALVVVDDVRSTNLIDATLDRSWREAEVELVAASDGYLDLVQSHLAAAGIHPAPVSSKLRIALGDLLDRQQS